MVFDAGETLFNEDRAWAEWAAQPSPEFFERVAALAGFPPEHLLYVGDRLDNDVLPARRLGWATVFIRRGPWGYIQGNWPEAESADVRVDTLDEVVKLLVEQAAPGLWHDVSGRDRWCRSPAEPGWDKMVEWSSDGERRDAVAG